MFKDIFEKITSIENIRQAYLDLVLKLDSASKSRRYKGINGTRINDLDFISEETLRSIQEELISFTKLDPVYREYIPKKNGGKRKIYVYTIKERIKAEAIYRILLPHFESYFSPYLFSYRSSHPSYYAARSAVRRYKRYYGENHILVTDISDYTDSIDQNILLGSLENLGIDRKTFQLIKLFVTCDLFDNGKMTTPTGGIMTGTPLSTLLANFYMDSFDKFAGKKVAFYRRVGDDMIAMDKDKTKIEDLNDQLIPTLESLKLKLSSKKARLIKDTVPFNFLGYRFKDKKIGFDRDSENKIIRDWKKLINYKKAKTEKAKLRHIKSSSKSGETNLHNQFKQLIKQKILVDDTDQIKNLSNTFFRILTTFTSNRYTEQKRRLISPQLKKTGAPSLFSYYKKAHYL